MLPKAYIIGFLVFWLIVIAVNFGVFVAHRDKETVMVWLMLLLNTLAFILVLLSLIFILMCGSGKFNDKLWIFIMFGVAGVIMIFNIFATSSLLGQEHYDASALKFLMLILNIAALVIGLIPGIVYAASCLPPKKKKTTKPPGSVTLTLA